jgi:CheY-like chemotaxis protein
MAKIVVVDDEEVVRELLRRILVESGHDVEVAQDANSALAVMARHKPDVAFIDIRMPGANGLWLADQIRDQHPTTAIVLATADADIPPTESLRSGIVAYLVKPFRRNQVTRAAEEGIRWSAHVRRH